MRERKNHETGNQSRSDANIVRRPIHRSRRSTMRELMIDFITSLDGYASGEGWPGWWGLEGPEYLAWLGEQPPVTYLMGANTYRLMYGFAGGETPAGTDEFRPRRRPASTSSRERRRWCSRPRSRSPSRGPTRPSCAATPCRRSGR